MTDDQTNEPGTLTQPDRRRFMTMAGLLGLSAGMPLALARFGDPTAGGPHPVDAGLATARHQGKPLLALVIPTDQHAMYARGTALGAWLNHGGKRTLADLSLCVVVCATLEELAARLPEIETEPDQEPCMVLIETSPQRASTTPIVIEFEKLDGHSDLGGDQATWEERKAADEAIIRKWIADLERGLRSTLELNLSAGQRANQALAELSQEGREALLGSAIDLDALPADLVDRGAAVLRWRGEGGRGLDPDQVQDLLAASAIDRLREKPPGGTHWASSSGCGLTIEGAQKQSMIACGMGHVPTLSRRFLYFFAVD